MGWADLFKSKKNAGLRPDPRLRWFGKLPTYADYYKSNTDESWAVEMNDWIMKGYEIFHTRQREIDRHVKRLPNSSFAIRLPKSELTAMGVVLDFGGDMRGRPFPICFYAGLPSALWPGPTCDRIAGLTRVWKELANMEHDLLHFFSRPSRFENLFGDREIDLSGVDADTRDEGWVKQAAAVSLSDWYAGTRPGQEGQDMEAWFRLVGRWGESIAKLEGEDFEATLVFPLSSRCPSDTQVAGWLAWLGARMDLARRALSLILVEGPGVDYGRLVVIAREEVSEADFLLLTPLIDTLNYVDDLSIRKVGDEPPPGPPLNLEISWADFVRGAA